MWQLVDLCFIGIAKMVILFHATVAFTVSCDFCHDIADKGMLNVLGGAYQSDFCRYRAMTVILNLVANATFYHLYLLFYFYDIISKVYAGSAGLFKRFLNCEKSHVGTSEI